ncbi:hypothetical protein [Spiroplasma chrysopicola]|uniref:Transmembrane protein n=1 Tax=Spiroplasma chrysopicola DF-1 TaxID=1276227 RepID=R4U0Z5_9MOLU|nr:hypothetical protein [Spiroplasma chrysopicola]AGM24982.1 hypothetical protein SCHRY_v1c04000 [Spiroplasma chrysopicola DF-1]
MKSNEIKILDVKPFKKQVNITKAEEVVLIPEQINVHNMNHHFFVQTKTPLKSKAVPIKANKETPARFEKFNNKEIKDNNQKSVINNNLSVAKTIGDAKKNDKNNIYNQARLIAKKIVAGEKSSLNSSNNNLKKVNQDLLRPISNPEAKNAGHIKKTKIQPVIAEKDYLAPVPNLVDQFTKVEEKIVSSPNIFKKSTGSSIITPKTHHNLAKLFPYFRNNDSLKSQNTNDIMEKYQYNNDKFEIDINKRPNLKVVTPEQSFAKAIGELPNQENLANNKYRELTSDGESDVNQINNFYASLFSLSEDEIGVKKQQKQNKKDNKVNINDKNNQQLHNTNPSFGYNYMVKVRNNGTQKIKRVSKHKIIKWKNPLFFIGRIFTLVGFCGILSLILLANIIPTRGFNFFPVMEDLLGPIKLGFNPNSYFNSAKVFNLIVIALSLLFVILPILFVQDHRIWLGYVLIINGVFVVYLLFILIYQYVLLISAIKIEFLFSEIALVGCLIISQICFSFGIKTYFSKKSM